jgi:hypothetical protein
MPGGINALPCSKANSAWCVLPKRVSLRTTRNYNPEYQPFNLLSVWELHTREIWGNNKILMSLKVRGMTQFLRNFIQVLWLTTFATQHPGACKVYCDIFSVRTIAINWHPKVVQLKFIKRWHNYSETRMLRSQSRNFQQFIDIPQNIASAYFKSAPPCPRISDSRNSHIYCYQSPIPSFWYS